MIIVEETGPTKSQQPNIYIQLCSVPSFHPPPSFCKFFRRCNLLNNMIQHSSGWQRQRKWHLWPRGVLNTLRIINTTTWNVRQQPQQNRWFILDWFVCSFVPCLVLSSGCWSENVLLFSDILSRSSLANAAGGGRHIMLLSHRPFQSTHSLFLPLHHIH